MKDAIQEQLMVARRNQILDAAAKVFAEKGFHSTTSKEIAQEAGIAAGTIYNYFENKTALLLGIFERMREAVVQGDDFAKLTQGDEEVDVRTFLRAFLSFPMQALKANNFGLFRVVVSEMMVDEELRARYTAQMLEPTMGLAEAQLQRWVDRGVIKAVDTRLVVAAFSGMVLGLAMACILGDEALAAKWDELPDFMADLLLDGLRKEGAA